MSNTLFFAARPRQPVPSLPLPSGDWRLDISPPHLAWLARYGMLSKFSLACWTMHTTRRFKNRDCRLLTLRHGRHLAGYCWAHPGFARYPFMDADDLQIGRVWTRPDYRGMGLAAATVSALTRQMQGDERTIWYLTSAENTASIRIAEKLGFELRGHGGIRGRPISGRYELCSN